MLPVVELFEVHRLDDRIRPFPRLVHKVRHVERRVSAETEEEHIHEHLRFFLVEIFLGFDIVVDLGRLVPLFRAIVFSVIADHFGRIALLNMVADLLRDLVVQLLVLQVSVLVLVGRRPIAQK